MYLKFSRLILEVTLFGDEKLNCDIEFSDGCTVIITDTNTKGKSSIINALVLALGFDDLVKSNVSALVNETLKYKGTDHKIKSAYIYLEIKNEDGDFLSVRREIQPDLSKGMLVSFSKLSDWNSDNVREYYIGQNSYNGEKGFHRLLSNFTDFPEIKVLSYDEDTMRLYMEYVFSAIFIEQKRGWSDIMANMPFYRVRDPKRSTISEILGMDFIRNNLIRNKLNYEVTKLKASYEERLNTLRNYLNTRHFSLKNLPIDINSEVWSPIAYLALEGHEQRSISLLLKERRETLNTYDDTISETEESDENGLKEKMLNISDEISTLTGIKSEKDRTLSSLQNAISLYTERKKVIEEDLAKNKEEVKIRKLFSLDNWSVKEQCPVCEQSIDESLLSQLKSFPTMSIDENLKYLQEQKVILEEVIKIEISEADTLEKEIAIISSQIKILMEQHAEIQNSLSKSIPSELMERARSIARLEQEIKTLEHMEEYTQNTFVILKQIYDQYHRKHGMLVRLKNDLSDADGKILNKFQTKFRKFLQRLGYNSFEINSLFIDNNTFMPRVIFNNSEQRKKMRPDFGSSASDWIRIITAYTLALHSCRENSDSTVHPNVTVFDEPKQQNLDYEDHLHFYDIAKEVCDNGGQIIVAETDKEHFIRTKASKLNMKIIDFKESYILSDRPNVPVN